MLLEKKLIFWSTKFFFFFAIAFCVRDEGKRPKELHQYFLENSPFSETKHLDKLDRFEKGLPPDRFNEEIYDGSEAYD